MARITELVINNYRSVEGPLTVRFPAGMPVVLIGENNAGKSNIVRALDLTLGSFWPGTHDPEDHEFYGRDRTREMRITVKFADDDRFGRYKEVNWWYDPYRRAPDFKGYPDRDGRDQGFINNDDRDTCVCVTLQAERDLRDQLSYRSKYTLLSKLMHRFHKALQDQEDVRVQLVALFEGIKTKFNELDDFREFSERLQDQLGDFIGSMSNQLQVDFEAYNPVNFFHALRLQAVDAGGPRVIDEMGTGEQQILALSFAYAYARAFHGGIVLVLEEPESHLHPLAQQWLAKRLRHMCADGLQIVITSHSAHFIDVLGLEGLIVVSKREGRTEAVQLTTEMLVQHCVQSGAPADRVTAANVLPFYRAAATADILEGFFAKVVVLVEGMTEALALPVLLERVGLDGTREGVAVISVQGKSSLARWRRLFGAYGIPVYIVFDNDARDDGNSSGRRDALVSVGVEAEHHDDLIAADHWVISNRYTIFGRDYEHVLRAAFPLYVELEAQGRASGIGSKPFLARAVAEMLPYDGAEGWERLREMAEHVRALA